MDEQTIEQSGGVRTSAGGPSQDEAEQAVRTLIKWAGDDPEREGLRETPSRVARAYKEWFAGYEQSPEEFLQRTFEEVAGYDEIVLLRDVQFVSHCEHHMAPIHGRAHIGYLPRRRVVGISKLVRLIEVYGRRLQIQERMTAEIAGPTAVCSRTIYARRPMCCGPAFPCAHRKSTLSDRTACAASHSLTSRQSRIAVETLPVPSTASRM